MMGTFFGYSKISNSNPQTEYFQKKGKISFFQKCVCWGVRPRKLSLSKIGVIDMSYIMDSGLNTQYTTFPNIFSLISAESADLSTNQRNHIFEKKMAIFESKMCSRRARTASICIAR